MTEQSRCLRLVVMGVVCCPPYPDSYTHAYVGWRSSRCNLEELPPKTLSEGLELPGRPSDPRMPSTTPPHRPTENDFTFHLRHKHTLRS